MKRKCVCSTWGLVCVVLASYPGCLQAISGGRIDPPMQSIKLADMRPPAELFPYIGGYNHWLNPIALFVCDCRE